MARSLCVLAGLAVVAAIAAESRLSGQSSSASLTVTANVSKNCTITTSPVNFGAYDPVAANATAPLDGTGILTVTCTKGAMAHVGLSPGSNAQGSTRRMQQSATSFLTYEIYKDAGRTIVWGNDIGSNLDIGPAPNRNPRTFTAYGRVPQAQDATVGSYTDTVVATVNF
jgi:spore coat protein U-like protein